VNLADCTPGREVVIGAWFLPGSGLGGAVCTVLDTRLAPAKPADNPAYPHGMVQVRLPDSAEWGCREPWIGPEDLACLHGDLGNFR
jgi:hypothetical protein